MFSLFGKKAAEPERDMTPMLLDLRETLYTHASLEPFIARIPAESRAAYPWANFIAANESIKQGDNARAIAQLKEIIAAQEKLETRFHLQAWHTLVTLGELPVEGLRAYTQGVVIENYTEKGLDITAAFVDHTARYWDHTGAGVVWQARDPQIDRAIFNLLSTGFEITKRIGIGLRDTPPAPEKGNIRIFIMAYAGSTVGEGRFEQISKDPMGNAAITAGNNLKMALMKKRGTRKENDVVVFRN
jgi:hypothetical protein